MGGNFDLIKMRHSITLLKRLKLRRRVSRLAQLNFEFFFEMLSCRIHANTFRGK